MTRRLLVTVVGTLKDAILEVKRRQVPCSVHDITWIPFQGGEEGQEGYVPLVIFQAGPEFLDTVRQWAEEGPPSLCPGACLEWSLQPA